MLASVFSLCLILATMEQIKLALGVEWDYSVYSLHDSGSEQDESRDEGDEHPRVPEVAVHQAGSPPVPPLPAVRDHLPLHAVEAAVRAHHRSPAEIVEQRRHSLIAAEQVADDPSRFQQRHVPGRVDEVVQEDDGRHRVVAGAGVHPLERHQVEEHALRGIHHMKQRDG
uniref:Expressed protein n=1 Tax=Oryza sativa subsp. japonica TaxID=39947 RepID=Q2R313_ORYSJ|nr:expressed protein [Oryza sativa Japonica Group]